MEPSAGAVRKSFGLISIGLVGKRGNNPSGGGRAMFWGPLGMRLHSQRAMENTLGRDKHSPVELNERSLVALNKIRAFVRTLGKVEPEKGFVRRGNDYAKGDPDRVSSGMGGT